MNQVEVLEELIAKILEEQKQQYQGKKVLGFTLSLLKDGNGRPQWRAHAWYNGKSANIYIGKDAQKAEKKIRTWVEKHPHFKSFLEKNSV